jgi:hypothetical protein
LVRIDLEEAELRERAAHRLGEPVAQLEVALERRTAQVVQAVAQPDRLLGVALLLDREGRRRRRVEDPQLGRHQLHAAARQLAVHGLRRAPLEDAAHGQHELAAQLRGALVGARRGVGPEHHLYEAAAVAQVDEDDAAVVAAALDPAREDQLAADEGFANLARAVGPAQVP